MAQSIACGIESDAARRRVADALVTLSRDEDSKVRDWACFGLSQIDVDTPTVREALILRLNQMSSVYRCQSRVGADDGL
jgi:hypothetical protein